MIKEEIIITRVLNGDAGAFKVLVDTYKDLVFSLVFKIVKKREEAEEVAQDTFLKAYHALGNFKNESKFSTWLFRIAYNTAVSKIRKKNLLTSTIDDYIIENYSVDEMQENMERMEENERLFLLSKAIASLPEEEQVLINLFYYNHQSIDEIALITELTDANVKVKLHRIRKKIYNFMNEQLVSVKNKH